MKTRATLTAAIFCGLSAVSSAFSLDFTGNLGQTLNPGTFLINVPIYGDVKFEAVSGTLTVVDTFENNTVTALKFATGDRVKISFLGLQPINVSRGDTEVNVSQELKLTADGVDPNVYYVELLGTLGTAGLRTVAWEQVPEPSTAILGALGGALLVFRRRR